VPTQFRIEPVHIAADSSLSESSLPKSAENFLDCSSSSFHGLPESKEDLLETRQMSSSSNSLSGLPESKEDILRPMSPVIVVRNSSMTSSTKPVQAKPYETQSIKYNTSTSSISSSRPRFDSARDSKIIISKQNLNYIDSTASDKPEMFVIPASKAVRFSL